MADDRAALIAAAFAVMRRTGRPEPRVVDVVRAAGLSNRAFYRTFRSRDELMLALLEEGVAQLVAYLDRRLAGISDPAEIIGRWVEGVVHQARHPRAARATRPFALNAYRLVDRFPDASRAALARLTRPLRDAFHAAASPHPELDADAVAKLTLARVQWHLALGTTPTDEETSHTVRAALAVLESVRDATPAREPSAATGRAANVREPSAATGGTTPARARSAATGRAANVREPSAATGGTPEG